MRHFMIALVVLSFPAITHAATLNVPSQFPTIQQAIDAAANGDTVLVDPGIYVENIDFLGKDITVKSGSGPHVTIIDGSQAGVVVTIQNGDSSTPVLEGFTIFNGCGGILCCDSSPTITRNIIRENHAWDLWGGEGGGIYCKGGSPTIDGNMILDNKAWENGLFFGFGGGICCDLSAPTVSNNFISGNCADGPGGGIHIRGEGCVVNNILIGNIAASSKWADAGAGGGVDIRLIDSSVLLTNNTIYSNSATGMGGGIAVTGPSEAVIADAISWNNEAPEGPEMWIGDSGPGFSAIVTIDYSNVEGGQGSVHVETGCTLNWGPGMIDTDPLFVTGPYGFHYLSQVAAGQPMDSPCVDTGSDLAGNLGMDIYWTRTDGIPDSGIVDMGFHYAHFIFPALQTDTTIIPDGTGGEAVFLLNGGMESANRSYILLGSMTGTEPGTTLPGGMATLPLNWDLFTSLIIDYINTPIFSDFMGTLDGTGSATATFDTLQPVPGLGGTTLHFAYALNHPWNFVSNPVGITIIPSDVNWRQYGYDPQRTGYNPYETMLSPATVNKLQVQWTRSFSWSVYTAPAVVDGVVYMATYGDYFYALDAETGATLWQRFVDGNTGGPTVYDGLVYFGSRHSPVMYALDAKDGSIIWSTPVADIVGASSPALADGVVYVGTASNGQTLYALDAKTGNPLWTATCMGALFSPVIGNGIVYVGASSDTKYTVYAFDAKTGNTVWSLMVSDAVYERAPRSVAVSDGVVYTGAADGHLYALDADTGDILWKGKTGGLQVDSPAVANGVIYVASNDSKLYAFDAKTHQIKWSATAKSDLRGKPTVANGVVYAAEAEGPRYVYALNAKTGGLLWEYDLGSLLYNTYASPTVVNGKMYVPATFNYSIYAFHLPE